MGRASAYNPPVRGGGSLTLGIGVALVGVTWVAPRPLVLPIGDAAPALVGLVAAAAVALAARFRRGRLAVSSLLLLLLVTLLRDPALIRLDDEPWARRGLAGALALALTVLSFARDRPLFARRTLALALTLAIPACLAAAAGPEARRELAGIAWPTPFTVVAVAALVLAGRFALRRTAFDAVLLVGILGAAAAHQVATDVARSQAVVLAVAVALLVGWAEETYRLAYHDTLTGLPGRRALDEAMTQLGERYVIAMLDVDHFKRFNDRFGHDAGDQVLRMVASEIARAGGGGEAFRYGGEEFTVLFAGATIDEARTALEEVRRAIAERVFALRAPDRPRKRPSSPRPAARTIRTHVTVSIGLAAPNAKRSTPAAVREAADRALYRAKDAGRNRVLSV